MFERHKLGFHRIGGGSLEDDKRIFVLVKHGKTTVLYFPIQPYGIKKHTDEFGSDYITDLTRSLTL